MSKMPVLFVPHGAPTLPLEPSAARDFLTGLGAALGRPRAILAVSAHWETEQPAVSTAVQPETIYDFHGFPEALYRLRYPAPGAPQLAARVAGLLAAGGMPARPDPQRGLDHGAWTPLILMYPQADIPVAQLSIQPGAGPQHHLALGAALRPLRDEGVLILASGSVTHNLHAFRAGNGRDAPPPEWVTQFNAWLAAALREGRRADLAAYRSRAPHAARNHPTEEHLLPLFVAAGAADGGGAQRLHSSYAYGVIGMDAYRFD